MLWKVDQVAKYLGISIALVYKMVSKNELPYVKISNCIRFWPETIESISKERYKDLNKDTTNILTKNNELNFNSQYSF